MPVLLTEEASDDLANASARHPEFRGDGRGVLAELALTDDRSVSFAPRVGRDFHGRRRRDSKTMIRSLCDRHRLKKWSMRWYYK